MSKFKKGQMVYVTCQVEPGPLDELVVTVDTVNGPISGFVKTDYVLQSPSGRNSVRGQVVEDLGDSVQVRLPGSFFTTSGVASMSATDLRLAA
jgi:hypothetical protein